MLSADNQPVCQTRRMDIGSQIRAARAAQGITQRALAKALGVSHPAIAHWESGLTKPSILNRVDISGVLNIPFQDLLPENGAAAASGVIMVDDPVTYQIVACLRKLQPKERGMVLKVAAAMAAPDPLDAADAALPPPPPPPRRQARRNARSNC